jgi:hypothetical protein
MKKEIGWTERTATGRREISVKLFGGKAYWAWREARGEWDEDARPLDHHWDELIRLLENRAARGQGGDAWLEIARNRVFGERRGVPRQSMPRPAKKPGNVLG